MLNKFKYAYEYTHQRLVDDSQIYLVRRAKQAWNIDTLKKFITTIDYLLNDYCCNKIFGDKDISQIRKLKGLIWKSECDRMWYLQNINPKTNVFHLRSKVYACEFFNPLPTISEDCEPMLGLYETLNSSLIIVACEPEGTGPNTHYKVLQVVSQALRLKLKCLLGNDYFDLHCNEQTSIADGIILSKEMNVADFLKHAQDLRGLLSFFGVFFLFACDLVVCCCCY